MYLVIYIVFSDVNTESKQYFLALKQLDHITHKNEYNEQFPLVLMLLLMHWTLNIHQK